MSLRVLASELAAGGVLLLSSLGAGASDSIALQLLDKNGQPVPDAVVYVADAPVGATDTLASIQIDQKDNTFVPHVTVVPVGTEISFPNSDTVSHHVYSFSTANRFELPLYKGETRPAVSFKQSGLITLGCNIHDSMLAYVLVVDSGIAGVTDANGQLTLQLPRATDQWRVWSPSLRTQEILEPLTTAADPAGVVILTVDTELRNANKADSKSLSWDEY